MSIAQTPARSRFANFVAQLLCNSQMSLMIVDRGHKIPQQCVRVSKTVTRLSLNSSFSQVNRQRQGSPLTKNKIKTPSEQVTFMLRNYL